MKTELENKEYESLTSNIVINIRLSVLFWVPNVVSGTQVVERVIITASLHITNIFIF